MRDRFDEWKEPPPPRLDGEEGASCMRWKRGMEE